MKEKLIALFMAFAIYTCSANKSKTVKFADCRNINDSIECEEKMISFKELPEDEKEAFNTVVNFYLWYCENSKKLNQDKFFSLHKEDGYYSYNFKYIEEYLDKFKQSGYVSDSFLENLRDIILLPEKELTQNKFLVDEENYGFEADIIFNSQDPDLYVQRDEVELQEFKINNSSIEVQLWTPLISAVLHENEVGKWVLDSFGGV